MNQHLTRGFADEIAKLAKSVPGQGMLTAMADKGLGGAVKSQNKSMLRSGNLHNIAKTEAKDLSNLPKIPSFK